MSDQNNIEHITVGLAAGDNKVFAMSGTYFELIDCPNTVDVFLQDFNGVQKARLIGASASFFSDDVEFGVIQISSSTAQTVKFAYGSGKTGTRRTTGSMAITNTPTVALQAADAALIRRPELPGANWKDNSTMAVNTPLTIFSPGSNVNGAIIWTAEAFDTNAAAFPAQAFIAKASAPVSNIDGEVVAQSLPGALISGSAASYIKKEVPTRIAAGLGLYFISNVAGLASPSALRNCRYTLL